MWCRKNKRTLHDFTNVLSKLQDSLLHQAITSTTNYSLNTTILETLPVPISANRMIKLMNRPILYQGQILTALLQRFLSSSTLEDTQIRYLSNIIVVHDTHGQGSKEVIQLSYRLFVEGKWQEAEQIIHRFVFVFVFYV